MSNLKKLLFVLSVVAVLGVSETVLAKANTESTTEKQFGDEGYWSSAVGDTALGGEQFVFKNENAKLKINTFSDADVLKLDGTVLDGEKMEPTKNKQEITTNFTDKTKENRQKELKKWYDAGRKAQKTPNKGAKFGSGDANKTGKKGGVMMVRPPQKDTEKIEKLKTALKKWYEEGRKAKKTPNGNVKFGSGDANKTGKAALGARFGTIRDADGKKLELSWEDYWKQLYGDEEFPEYDLILGLSPEIAQGAPLIIPWEEAEEEWTWEDFWNWLYGDEEFPEYDLIWELTPEIAEGEWLETPWEDDNYADSPWGPGAKPWTSTEFERPDLFTDEDAAVIKKDIKPGDFTGGDATGATGSGSKLDGFTDEDATGATGTGSKLDGFTDEDATGATGTGSKLDGFTDEDATGATGSGSKLEGFTDEDATGVTGSGSKLDGFTDEDATGATGSGTKLDGFTDEDATGATGSGTKLDSFTDEDAIGATGTGSKLGAFTDEDATGATGAGTKLDGLTGSEATGATGSGTKLDGLTGSEATGAIGTGSKLGAFTDEDATGATGVGSKLEGFTDEDATRLSGQTLGNDFRRENTGRLSGQRMDTNIRAVPSDPNIRSVRPNTNIQGRRLK